MSINTQVLPNFLKTVLFTAAASMSISAFAGHHEEGEAKIGDLKDMTSETDLKMQSTQDELKAMLAEEEAAAESETGFSDTDVDDILNEAKDEIAPEAE